MENNKKYLKTIFELPLAGYIFIILPIALLTGSLFSDLIVSIMALSGLFILIKREKSYLYFNKFLFIFFVYSFFLILLSLKSDHVYLSLEASLFYIRFILFSFVVYNLMHLNKKIINYFFYFFFYYFYNSLYRLNYPIHIWL